MTIQSIIDTFNYSTVTGCKLTEKASNNLYQGILSHIDVDAQVDKAYKSPRFTEVNHTVPEDFTTFTGYRPRTKNLYGNYCELELLRILYLLKPEADQFRPIFEATKQRISETCYGSFCATGECFEISILALRYIATIFPEEKLWIDMYVRKIAATFMGRSKKISRRSLLMFCQVLSELRRPQDAEVIDGLLALVDDRHLPEVSRITTSINECIFYSSLRRSPMAS